MNFKEEITDKKVLVLFGSANKGGNTAKALKKLLNFLGDPTIKFVDAYKRKIEPCTGCAFCRNKLKCVYDDMDDIYEFLKECDIIIFAFPIYNYSMPSPLKAIFDRFQIYYNSKVKMGLDLLKEKSKICFVLTTQGTSENLENILATQMEKNIKLLNVQNIVFFSVRGTDIENFDIDKWCLKSENKMHEYCE